MSEKISVKTKAKKKIVLWGILLPTLVLTVLFIASLFATLKMQKDKQYLVETIATISFIDVATTSEYDWHDEEYQYTEENTIEHIVYVDYVAEGKQYRRVRLNKYSVDMRVGDEITIFYDSRNPESIQSPTNIGFIFLIVVSMVIVIYLIIFPTILLKRKKRIKNLMDFGECHRVTITEVANTYLAPINKMDIECGEIEMVLIAKFKDVKYISDRIVVTDAVYPGCTINLYLDKGIMKKNRNSRVKNFRKTVNNVYNYYMDLSSIEAGSPLSMEE